MANEPMISSRGFTLIEMLIVLAIIGVITAIAVTGQQSFDRSVILTNTAYDVALSIREAQAYGFSGKSATLSASDSGNYAYGIDFNINTPTTYTLFADNGTSISKSLNQACHSGSIIRSALFIPPDYKKGDCYFSNGISINDDTIIKKFTINNGVAIKGTCVYTSSNLKQCAQLSGSENRQLDISFTRPNSIHISLANYQNGSSLNYTGDIACIQITRLGSNQYILVKGNRGEAGIISVSHTPNLTYCP